MERKEGYGAFDFANGTHFMVRTSLSNAACARAVCGQTLILNLRK